MSEFENTCEMEYYFLTQHSKSHTGMMLFSEFRSDFCWHYNFLCGKFCWDQPLIHVSVCCAWLMITLSIIGVLGNALSAFVFTRAKMRSSINTLLAALSVADLVLLIMQGWLPEYNTPYLLNIIVNSCVCVVPTFTLTPIYTWSPSKLLVITSNLFTKYGYPLACMAQTASVWLFLIISTERYIAVCYPLMVQVHCTIERARYAVLVVVSVAVIYNLCRFWDYKLSDEGPLCAIGTGIRSYPWYRHLYLFIAYVSTQFIIPFISISVLNSKVAKTILAARKQHEQMSTSQRSEHRTATMMLIVILIFVGCYLLSGALAIIDSVSTSFYSDEETAALAYALTDISNTLIVFNSTSTAIIYFIFSKNYRTIVVSLFMLSCPCVNWCVKESTIDSFINDRTTTALGYAAPIRAKTMKRRATTAARIEYRVTVRSSGASDLASRERETDTNLHASRGQSLRPSIVSTTHSEYGSPGRSDANTKNQKLMQHRKSADPDLIRQPLLYRTKERDSTQNGHLLSPEDAVIQVVDKNDSNGGSPINDNDPASDAIPLTDAARQQVKHIVIGIESNGKKCSMDRESAACSTLTASNV